MGHERRNDSDLDVKQKQKGDGGKESKHDDEQVDTKFASKILEQRTWDQIPEVSPPESYVKGSGDQDKLDKQLDDALAANNGKDLVAIVTKMSRPTRDSVQKSNKLPAMMNLVDGGDALRLADLLQADIVATVDAALGMSKPPSLHQMRAYLADVHPMRLLAFDDPARRKLFSQTYSGPITHILPQLLDDLVFQDTDYSGLVSWWFETTPAATVARTLLASTKKNVWQRIVGLEALGRSGWEWILAVDEAMVIAAEADVAETFQLRAPDPDLKQALADKIAAKTKGASARVAKDLHDHKKEHVAKDSAEQLSTQSRAAGQSFDEQVALMLAKPKVTLDEVRLASAIWVSESGGFTVGGLQKLADHFPSSTPADVLGIVPDQVYKLAIKNKGLRPWFVDKAEPIEILRFVTYEPAHIAELCNWLVGHKTGYDWVYKLGGGVDDHLIRRFAIECPDLNVKEWVKNHILADWVKPGGHEIGSTKIDPKAYQSTSATLNDDLARPTATEKDVAGDVDALSDKEAAELRKDPTKLKGILDQVGNAYAMRVVERVQPRLRDVLSFVPAKTRGIVEWISTRKDDDIVEGFGHHAAAARAQTVLPALGPLELVPQLEKPEVLAQVLRKNPELIGWVMISEAAAAVTTLGSPACAADTVHALVGHEKLVGKLPPGKSMPPNAREALGRLAKLSSGDLHSKLTHKLDENRVDPEVDTPKQKQLNVEVLTATKKSTLVEALEQAFEDKPSDEVILRICSAHPDQALTLLKDGDLVAKVRQHVPLSPRVLFKDLPYATLLSVPAGAKWLFETTTPDELLHAAMKDPDASAQLIKALNSGSRQALDWCDSLPRGKALKRAEKNALKGLADHLSNVDAHKALFAARYDVTVAGTTSNESLKYMWEVLERVPESHISDGVVQSLISWKPSNEGSTVAGEYDEGSMTVREGMKGQQRTGNREGANSKVLMTKQEAMENLGLDEKTFQQWVKDKRLTQDGELFRIGLHVETDVLKTTLLHELGHGVHHMIGNQSELIFDLVGWKAYSESEFDAWAAEMGGWSGVKAEDQDQIREVWMMWLSSSRGDMARESVLQMVRPDHPAVSKDYAGVGIVELARSKSMANRKDAHLFGDRAAFVSHQQQRWYTISKKGLLSAPGDYALEAPGEYFAECYMQYYQDWDGDPKHGDKKGYRLAPWIKEWFDKNVDNTTRNPRAGDDFSGDQ